MTSHSFKPFLQKLLLRLSMASLASLAFVFLILIFVSSPPATLRVSSSPAPVAGEIQQACNATRYSELCISSMSRTGLPNHPTAVEIILGAIQVSSQNLETAQSMVQTIFATTGGNPNMSTAVKNCKEVLGYSQYRISLSSTPETMKQRKKDVRAWMSAALLYQYDCWSALKYVNTTYRVNETMAFLDGLIRVTSNALSLVRAYDLAGEDLERWLAPKTERDGFWEESTESGSGLDMSIGFPAVDQADVVVCKNEPGCYRTVQSAVDASPERLAGRKYVIRIEEGIYEEMVRIPLEKQNVVLVGKGIGETVITGSRSVQTVGVSTYNTATMGVVGDGFMARDITFQNTAGPDAHQAVAFRSSSDLSWLHNCEFIGHQDTLYAHSLRQLYTNCTISGTIDFIFGNSASIFHNCLILVSPRQLKPDKGETNAIAAQGRTDPSQSTGFIFRSCTINGTHDYMVLFYKKPKVHKNYFGRPWKEYSRTVFIGCEISEIIRPEGWVPWSGDFALSTLFYGEHGNRGPGSDPSKRVPWSNQIPLQHVPMYSVENFIQGKEWIQS